MNARKGIAHAGSEWFYQIPIVNAQKLKAAKKKTGGARRKFRLFLCYCSEIRD